MKSRFDESVGGAIARWSMAAVVMLGAHAGGAWLSMHWPTSSSSDASPPPAVMIDLAPIAISQDAPQQDVATGPQMAESQPEPPKESPREDDAHPEDTKPVEPDVRLPDALTMSETVIEPRQEQADVTLPVAAPPPPVKPPDTKEPVERKKPEASKSPVDRTKPRQRQTLAPPVSDARRADRTAAPSPGSEPVPSSSPATWRSLLNAHLNRFKRLPGGASRGMAYVRFSIDRAGRVLAASLARTSGDAILDSEAVALIRRASPVPAPPSQVTGSAITLTVPVNYSR